LAFALESACIKDTLERRIEKCLKKKLRTGGTKRSTGVMKNRETLAVVIPLGVAGVTATSKLVNKSINHHQIAVLKDKR